ncbi:MAG: alanine--tRNA ligase [Acidobacteria bacterium]|nr:alanine--tRNA ligase [Acidobacteriota bacterium]
MSTYENLSETQKFACRVIADHARSTAFSIADGILPGNEGRNYVLRKIMRRAIYHGREHLGFNEPFFYKVCDFVVDEMQAAFPELGVQRGFIGKMVRLEEERFGNTMTVGLGKLGELSITPETQPNDELFLGIAKLYDTYGTPRDLIRVFLEEKGLAVEEDDYNERFDAALQELQKQTGIGQTQRKSEISPMYAEMLERVGANKFHGYEVTRLEEARVVGILDGDKQVDVLNEGQQGSVILDETPFYAESGGQVGDTGVLVGIQLENHPVGETPTPLLRKEGSFRATVADTYSPVAGLIIHKVKVDAGSIKAGDTVTAIVDEEKRDATRRNHTATHLVHAALKEVLGTHVKQAGSVVAPNYLRFDFTHYQPMTAAEIREVEDLVNRYVLQNEPVTTKMMSLEDAMRSGAVAMFGEKYGSEVRVLRVGDGKFSMELCGGTHVRATGDIGSFKITSDEAIASGVRRIRAITGFDAFERFREDEVLIDRSLEALKTQRDNLPAAIERLQEEVKRTRKEIEELKLKIATGAAGNGSAGGDEAREIGGVKVLGKIVDGLDANGQRQLSDTLLARLKSGVVVLGRKDEGKASIIVRVSADLTDKIKAGNIVKEIVPLLGGRGGGRPDMAEGGGPDADKLSEAIDVAYASIEKMAS